MKISHFKENNESFGELKKKDGCWVTGNWESTFIGLMSANFMTSFLYPPASIFVYLLNIFIDHEHTEWFLPMWPGQRSDGGQVYITCAWDL